jgi:hypothetical protein
LGWIVEVKISLNYFAPNGAVFVIELSKTFYAAPRPITVLAANSPTVQHLKNPTSVGGTQ